MKDCPRTNYPLGFKAFLGVGKSDFSITYSNKNAQMYKKTHEHRKEKKIETNNVVHPLHLLPAVQFTMF
jgi:hypothetical protein